MNMEGSDFMKRFFLSAGSSPFSAIISRLHKGLQRNTAVETNKLYVNDKWQTEGNFSLTEEEWEKICTVKWESTSSNTRREFNWKNHIRCFISPLQKIMWSKCSKSLAYFVGLSKFEAILERNSQIFTSYI